MPKRKPISTCKVQREDPKAPCKCCGAAPCTCENVCECRSS